MDDGKWLQLRRRYRQLRTVWKVEGREGISDRLRSVIASHIAPRNTKLPVRRVDVLAANLDYPTTAHRSERASGQTLVINWVIIPAAANSGGHTTIFRMMKYLQARGHTNHLYFYNVYGGDHEYYESIARKSYGFTGAVHDLSNNLEDADALIATSWATAYPVFNSSSAGKKFYFVQDYEPSFYPVGALGLLAENTYRMGLHAITAGRWLSEKLAVEYGMKAEPFEFGCDTSVYHLLPEMKRRGVIFYARPEAARRGFELGMMAMELFAQRNPDVPIHLYGDTAGKVEFPCIHHGRVRPSDLNDLYNQCAAGLSLSLTNVSLVPHEMLAAGCIPIVNDAPQNRIVLDNPNIQYADAYPGALVAALERVLQHPDAGRLAASASASVVDISWETAGATVESILKAAISEAFQPDDHRGIHLTTCASADTSEAEAVLLDLVE